MLKNTFTFLIWQIIGILFSHTLFFRFDRKKYLFLLIIIQTVVSLLIFEYGSKHVKLGYFSSNAFLLAEVLRDRLKIGCLE